MRKLVVLAAVLAMMLVAVMPAAAQTFQEGGVAQQVGDQDQEAGEVDATFDVSSQGAEQQPAEVQAEETVEAVAPETKAEEKVEVKVEEKAPAPAPKAEAKAGEVVAKAEAPKVEVKVEQKKEAPKAEVKVEQKKEEKKELPKTGGSGGASLFALGTGVLLIGGGLLIRKLVR